MASAGTVTVDFVAEVAKFNAQLKTVQTSLGTLQKQFDTFGSFVKKTLDLLGGAALLSFAKSAITAADAIGDAAARMGTTVETLSKLKFAARETDVQFESLEVAIRKFQDTMSEARAGNQAAIQTFIDLGISAEQLKGLELDQQLGLIADRFKDIQDPADKVRIAIDLFGRSGNELIPFLDKGSAGLQELMDKAEQLGVVLDTQTSQAVDRATKTLETFKDQITVVAARAVAGWDLILNGAPTAALRTDDRLRAVRAMLTTFDAIIASGAAAGRDKAFLDQVAALRAEEQKLTAEQEKQLSLGTDNVTAIRAQTEAAGQLAALSATIKPPTIDIALSDAEQAKQQQELLDQQIAGFGAEAAAQEQAIADRLQREQDAAITELGIQRLLADQKQVILQDQWKAEADVQAMVASLRQGAFDAGIGLLQAYAGRSKAVAIALIAIHKAQAIASVIVSTAAASAKALEVYGPTPAGYAAAASAKLWGAVQIGLIAASGLVEAGNVGSGGAALGTPSNPVFTQPNPNGTGGLPTPAGQSVTSITIEGDVFSSEKTAAWLIDQLQDAINGRDVVIINANSRQGQELVGG